MEDVGDGWVTKGEPQKPDALPAIVPKNTADTVIVCHIQRMHLLNRVFYDISSISEIRNTNCVKKFHKNLFRWLMINI